MGAVPLMQVAVASTAIAGAPLAIAPLAAAVATIAAGAVIMHTGEAAEKARNYAFSDAAEHERNDMNARIAKAEAKERAPQQGHAIERRTDWAAREDARRQAAGAQLGR